MEKALTSWARNQKGKGIPVTDEALRSQLQLFTAIGTSAEVRTAINSPTWLEKFKQRNAINSTSKSKRAALRRSMSSIIKTASIAAPGTVSNTVTPPDETTPLSAGSDDASTDSLDQIGDMPPTSPPSSRFFSQSALSFPSPKDLNRPTTLAPSLLRTPTSLNTVALRNDTLILSPASLHSETGMSSSNALTFTSEMTPSLGDNATGQDNHEASPYLVGFHGRSPSHVYAMAGLGLRVAREPGLEELREAVDTVLRWLNGQAGRAGVAPPTLEPHEFAVVEKLVHSLGMPDGDFAMGHGFA